MKTLHVSVADKRATYNKEDGPIVCGNADYQIEFEFDEEWAAHDKKTAVIKINGKPLTVEFEGNICPLPILSKVVKIEVGVYVDDELATTDTEIPCLLSCRCYKTGNEIIIPEIPEYNGETELLVPTVSGVWVFNETLPISTEDLLQEVNFISGGTEFVRMLRTYEAKEDTNIVNYSDERGKESGDYYSNGWNGDEYRTIDFGTTPQEVSEEFYTWLTANAVKQ